MNKIVLDSSVVLAILGGEAGAAAVAPSDQALICSVNFAEVISKLCERGGELVDIRGALDAIGLHVIDFDAALAERTGTLRPESKSRGLSLGDRACLALAEREGVPALTSD